MKTLRRTGLLTRLGNPLSEGVYKAFWPVRRLACYLFGHITLRTDGYTPITREVHCYSCGAKGEEEK